MPIPTCTFLKPCNLPTSLQLVTIGLHETGRNKASGFVSEPASSAGERACALWDRLVRLRFATQFLRESTARWLRTWMEATPGANFYRPSITPFPATFRPSLITWKIDVYW